MVGAGAPRGPPRLLCFLMLVLLAIATVYSIFGIHLFRHFYSNSYRNNAVVPEFHDPFHEQFPSSVNREDDLGDAAIERQEGFQYGRVWSPVQSLRVLLPFAAPRDVSYHAPVFPDNGFLFSTIIGELHEIHAAVCDFVVIARLLNATIVLPKIQPIVSVKGGGGSHSRNLVNFRSLVEYQTTSLLPWTASHFLAQEMKDAFSDGCFEVASSKVESFSYLYDEQHFIAALKDDVRVVKLLPKKFRTRTSLQKLPVKTPPIFSSTQYYLEEVLPALAVYGACGLVFSDGGGLQSILPPELVEYQRLRCRVAFHGLRFRREIQDLGVQLVRRLEAHGRPYVVVQFGLERDVLAHHGCAELFQDLQTESIQLQRKHFLNIGKEVGDLEMDSQKQRYMGLCPLMPTEVGLLLESFGFRNDTRIYMAGTEITGGQRLLLPLRGMYPNLEDRFTLSSFQERSELLQGTQRKTMNSSIIHSESAFADPLKKLLFWRRNGPSPPNIVHSKSSAPKGWWRSVGDCESETENYFTSTPVEGEAKRIQLLHAALDYVVALEANTYFPAFDRDRHGLPSIASLVMGHRLYQSASLKTFRPNRSALVALLDEYPDEDPDNANTWGLSVRRVLMDSLRPQEAHPSDYDASVVQNHVKSGLFLAHPLPECACRKLGDSQSHAKNNSQKLTSRADQRLQLWEGVPVCPAWMAGKY